MRCKIFKYVPEVDAFVVTDEYARMAKALGLVEWSPVVWIGRLFTLDNDYGEHWFDNWDGREARAQSAAAVGLDTIDLLVVNPNRFINNYDGPCHSEAIRREFWHDVLASLELSYSLVFAKARELNAERLAEPEDPDDPPIRDLEERIRRLATAKARSDS